MVLILKWKILRPQRPLLLLLSCSVVSGSLRPHGLQHARLPCPSPTPGVYSNSCPLSQCCHPTISFPVVPFSYLQSFPASGSFPMTQFFASGGQSIGVNSIKRQEVLHSSVQLLSHVRLFAIPWTAACQASLSITSSRSLLKLMSIESVMLSIHLILCCCLLHQGLFQ